MVMTTMIDQTFSQGGWMHGFMVGCMTGNRAHKPRVSFMRTLALDAMGWDEDSVHLGKIFNPLIHDRGLTDPNATLFQ